MLVSLQAVARRDDEEEPITLLTSGRLTLEDGRSVLTYEEVLDEALPPQPITITLETYGDAQAFFGIVSGQSDEQSERMATVLSDWFTTQAQL